MLNRYQMTQEENIFIAKRKLIDSIYQQANLEGIGVTFAQTQDILNNVNVDSLKPNEVSKVCCLRDGWNYLLDNLNNPLSLMFLEELHELVARFDVDYRYLGKIRVEDVLVSGTEWRPELPSFEEAEEILGLLNKSESITEDALRIGVKLMRLQFFKDGNKRIGSFVINKILIQNGCGLFSVPVKLDGTFKQKLVDYYESDDESELLNFIAKNCLIGLNENPKFCLSTVPASNTKPVIKDDAPRM